jgi:hypothetical protein
LSIIAALFVLFANNNSKTDSRVWRNMQKCSCNNCCGRKAVIITYSEFVIVALGKQHAMGILDIAFCGLPPLYNIFPRYQKNGMILEKKLF